MAHSVEELEERLAFREAENRMLKGCLNLCSPRENDGRVNRAISRFYDENIHPSMKPNSHPERAENGS